MDESHKAEHSHIIIFFVSMLQCLLNCCFCDVDATAAAVVVVGLVVVVVVAAIHELFVCL